MSETIKQPGQNQEVPIPSEEASMAGKSNNFYKIGFFILSSIFLVTLGVLGGQYFLSQKNASPPAGPTPTETILITTPTKNPSPTVEIGQDPESIISLAPTIAARSDLEQIKEAMAERHGKPVENTIITIGKNNGTHVSGGVKFEGEIAGAWFLAAKKDGEWVIVDDGNGTISCEVIEPWDFPVDMVPECVDEMGTPVSR